MFRMMKKLALLLLSLVVASMGYNIVRYQHSVYRPNTDMFEGVLHTHYYKYLEYPQEYNELDSSILSIYGIEAMPTAIQLEVGEHYIDWYINSGLLANVLPKVSLDEVTFWDKLLGRKVVIATVGNNVRLCSAIDQTKIFDGEISSQQLDSVLALGAKSFWDAEESTSEGGQLVEEGELVIYKLALIQGELE